MAEKKQSQAEKAVAAKRAKSVKGRKKYTQKNGNGMEPLKKEEKKSQIPVRFFTSAACLICFALLLVALLSSDGWIVFLFKKIFVSLFGQVAFYVAIPALLYLFTIQAFSGKRPVILRSVSLLSFVAICGCISQTAMLIANGDYLPSDMGVISALFEGGATGDHMSLLSSPSAIIMWNGP